MKTLEIVMVAGAMMMIWNASVEPGDFVRSPLGLQEPDSGGAIGSGAGSLRWQPSVETWQDAAYKANGPEEVCDAVRRRVQYSRDVDKKDEWRGVAETWLLGLGDCEDFALIIKAMCDQKGFAATIHVFVHTGYGEAHAVVVGAHYGVMWMSSNGSFEKVMSLEDGRRRVINQLGWFAGEVAESVR